MSSKAAGKEKVYQLKITLKGSKPPIWRRVLVTGDTSLHELHWVIQAAMGWTNSHLHQFVINKTCYSQPDFDLDETGDLAVKNEGDSMLSRFRFRPKDWFVLMPPQHRELANGPFSAGSLPPTSFASWASSGRGSPL